MKGWKVVYKTTKVIEAELVKSYLQESGIDAVVLNKVDRSLIFGTATVLCHERDVEEAERIINQNNLIHE